MTKSIFTLISILTFFSLSGQPKSLLDYNPNTSDYKVIVQMNYCISAMTNIIDNQSMDVLQKESDRLINNLKLTESVGITDIQEFRSDLMDMTAKFQITAEERSLTKRLTSMKRDVQKWDALSSAFSSPMILTSNGKNGMTQTVFYTLLTAARTAVEYQKVHKASNIEELKAMWYLRKQDLETVSKLRVAAYNYNKNLYEKYHISENDRLTEEDIRSFYFDYLTEQNIEKKLRILHDNEKKFYALPSYYYHIGMTYLDLNKYEKAKPYFNKYLELYSKAPIFRYDEMSGCIALAMLNNEKDLSLQSAETLINMALENMPSNSAAILQCALMYISKYKKIDKGLNILRKGIDDPKATDKDLLVMAAAKLIPHAKLYPHYNELKSAIETTDKLDISTYLTYIINSGESWTGIQKKLSFANEDYRNLTLIGTHLNNNVELHIDPKLNCNPEKIGAYIETHSEDEVKIRQLNLNQQGSFSMDEIDDVKCFKAYKDKGLAYLFVEAIVPNKTFIIKKSLNVESMDEDKIAKIPRISEFNLSLDDYKDIANFCKEHMVTLNGKTTLFSKPNKDYTGFLEVENSLYGNSVSSLAVLPSNAVSGTSMPNITYVGNYQFAYLPFHSDKMKGDYLRIRFLDGTSIMYKYDEDTKKLVPYLFVNVCDGNPKFSFTKLAISEECNLINRIKAPAKGVNVLFVGDDGKKIKLNNKFFSETVKVSKSDIEKLKF